MDFPKKQAQRLMPLYLLEYSEKLFTNHPDPSAPWGGGGGSDYTAGYGITITNDVILVDTNVIAKKSDIPSLTNYVTTTQLTDALDDYALKTEIPTDVSQLYNDAGYVTQTWVENQNYLPSSDFRGVYQADVEISLGGNKVVPHYSGIEYSKEFEDKRLTIKLEDMDNGNHPTISLSEHERTYIYPGHVDTVSSDNNSFTLMDIDGVTINKVDGRNNFTKLRQGGIEYNNINFNLNSNKQEFENYTIATLDDIPTVNNPTITFTQGGTTKGTITLNQSGDQTIEFDAGGTGTVAWDDITNKPTFATVATTGSYNDLTDKPTIPNTATSTSTSTVTPTTGTFVTGTSTNTADVVNSVTYTPSSETLTFTYADNTTASFTFLTSSTTVTSGTTSVVTSVTDSTSNAMTGATVSTSTTTTLS